MNIELNVKKINPGGVEDILRATTKITNCM